MLQNDLFLSENAKTRGRDACDPVAQLAAIVETMAARKASTRQIVEAVRTFASEARVAPRADAPATVWIALDSPEWRAWAVFWRATKGKTPPTDRRGGWRFPSRRPPTMQGAE